MCGYEKNPRVVVFLVDGLNIRPAALLHTIVGSFETCVGGGLSATAQLGNRRIVSRIAFQHNTYLHARGRAR